MISRAARRRAPVEAVFSALKRLYGKARARCGSLLVNEADYLAFPPSSICGAPHCLAP